MAARNENSPLFGLLTFAGVAVVGSIMAGQLLGASSPLRRGAAPGMAGLYADVLTFGFLAAAVIAIIFYVLTRGSR